MTEGAPRGRGERGMNRLDWRRNRKRCLCPSRGEGEGTRSPGSHDEGHGLGAQPRRAGPKDGGGWEKPLCPEDARSLGKANGRGEESGGHLTDTKQRPLLRASGKQAIQCTEILRNKFAKSISALSPQYFPPFKGSFKYDSGEGEGGGSET